MTTTRAQLTNLLKKAQKMDWYGTDHWTVTFGFVYQHPAAVDWEYTGSEARALYDAIKGTICTMFFESYGYGTNTFTHAGLFTDYQTRVLEL